MDFFPIWLSLQVSLAATALTFLAGVPVAWVLARRRFPGRDLLEALVVLPLILPPTVLGYYLLLVIGSQGPVGRALAVAGLELAFIQFVNGPEGRSIMKRYGFILPGEF